MVEISHVVSRGGTFSLLCPSVAFLSSQRIGVAVGFLAAREIWRKSVEFTPGGDTATSSMWT